MLVVCSLDGCYSILVICSIWCACRGSLIKVPNPPIVPHFKPLDYVQVLAQIHEELESCAPNERTSLYLLQFQEEVIIRRFKEEAIDAETLGRT